MGITRFFKTAITVKRMVMTGDKGVSTELGTFNGHIQQLKQDRIIDFAGNLDVDHSVWCAKDTNVQTSDILVADGINYLVKQIQKNVVTSTGSNQHLEILVKKTG